MKNDDGKQKSFDFTNARREPVPSQGDKVVHLRAKTRDYAPASDPLARILARAQKVNWD